MLDVFYLDLYLPEKLRTEQSEGAPILWKQNGLIFFKNLLRMPLYSGRTRYLLRLLVNGYNIS